MNGLIFYELFCEGPSDLRIYALTTVRGLRLVHNILYASRHDRKCRNAGIESILFLCHDTSKPIEKVTTSGRDAYNQPLATGQ